MDYLDQEIDKINEQLDLILLEKDIGESSTAQNELGQEASTVETTNIERHPEIVTLVDPDKIKQKGRPKNSKRLMPLVE